MENLKNLITRNPRLIAFSWASALILLFYQFRYGLALFNPSWVNWVIDNEELSNGFFSFGFFRHQAWGFPLGDIKSYFYPLGTNVYTSDIPILALLFKPFSGILPANFQYIGLWYLVSHLLQAWFAILLCERFGIKGLSKVFVIIFLLFPPLLMSRFIHPTLFCQWMILAGFWIYFVDTEKVPVKKVLMYQLGLFLLSGLVFAYLWAMMFGFLIALLLRLWLIDKKIRFHQAILTFLIHNAIMVSLWLLIGLISIGGIPNYEMSGWGSFSANLNALYNPMNFPSAVLPTFPFFPDQQLEGYNYLGAGILLLIAFCVIYYVAARVLKTPREKHPLLTMGGINILPLLLFLGFSFLYSLSSRVTLNSSVLFESSLSDSFSSIVNSFRSSGRFLWPCYYFIFIAVFYGINSLPWGTFVTSRTLGICLALQLYDIQFFLKPVDIEYKTYTPPINKVWEKLIESKDIILFFPGFRRTYLSFDDYRYFTYYATIHGKKINIGYPSRYDVVKAGQVVQELYRKISEEPLDDNTLYITFYPYMNRLALPIYNNEAYCFNIDGYLAVFKKTNDSKALAEFLEKNDAVNQQGVIAQQFLARRWKGFDESMDTKNSKAGIYETDDSDKHFYIKGWAFPEDPSLAVYDSVYLVLESVLKERWIAPIHRFKTQDVADFFHSPEKVNSGIGISLLKKNLNNGAYHAGLLFKDSKTGARSLHWMEYYVKINKTITPVRVNDLKNTLELKSNIYTLKDTLENVRVESWAFPAQGNCRSCKPFYTLRSKTHTYVAEAMIVPRPDVVSYFNDTSLLYSGMEAKFTKKSLEKGYYNLGMLLRDTIRSTDYFSETDKIIPAGIEDYATPDILTSDPVGKDSIQAFVDKVVDGKDIMKIDGWAFINQLSTDYSETSLILKSSDHMYSLATTPVARPDVQTYFKVPYTIDMAGFSVKFRKDKVPPGSYELYVVILNKKTNTKTLSRLGNEIKI